MSRKEPPAPPVPLELLVEEGERQARRGFRNVGAAWQILAQAGIALRPVEPANDR